MGPERQEPEVDDRSRLSSDGGEAFSFGGAVALIGAGRVASAFGRALAERGHRIASVAAATHASAEALAARLGARPASAPRATAAADLVVIAVPDDALDAVVEEIAPSVRAGAWVAHTCGRLGAGALRPCGPNVAAVHPATPVAAADASLEGVPFGVTCADHAWPFAWWLVHELRGAPVRVREEDRVLYHAALVIASNFTVGLAQDAIALSAKEIVVPLLRATVSNLERMDPRDALTGPIVRGDAGTVRAHVDALEKMAPEMVDAYRANSARLVEHATASGRIGGDAAKRIEEALRSR